MMQDKSLSHKEKLLKAREEFRKEADEVESEYDKAISFLDSEGLKTVKTLVQFRDTSKSPNLKFEAARFLAKLHGFEIERHEHAGKGGGPMLIEISADHARKIREAATK